MNLYLSYIFDCVVNSGHKLSIFINKFLAFSAVLSPKVGHFNNLVLLKFVLLLKSSTCIRNTNLKQKNNPYLSIQKSPLCCITDMRENLGNFVILH